MAWLDPLAKDSVLCRRTGSDPARWFTVCSNEWFELQFADVGRERSSTSEADVAEDQKMYRIVLHSSIDGLRRDVVVARSLKLEQIQECWQVIGDCILSMLSMFELESRRPSLGHCDEIHQFILLKLRSLYLNDLEQSVMRTQSPSATLPLCVGAEGSSRSTDKRPSVPYHSESLEEMTVTEEGKAKASRLRRFSSSDSVTSVELRGGAQVADSSQFTTIFGVFGEAVLGGTLRCPRPLFSCCHNAHADAVRSLLCPCHVVVTILTVLQCIGVLFGGRKPAQKRHAMYLESYIFQQSTAALLVITRHRDRVVAQERGSGVGAGMDCQLQAHKGVKRADTRQKRANTRARA